MPILPKNQCGLRTDYIHANSSKDFHGGICAQFKWSRTYRHYIIRRIVSDQSVELGTLEMNETKIGRLEHKIDKLAGRGHNAPTAEYRPNVPLLVRNKPSTEQVYPRHIRCCG